MLNSSQYVEQAIENCLGQTYTNIELLIVDGGSNDNTLDMCSRYTSSRVSLIKQNDNVGKLPGALNLGFRNARGEYLTWTHDDNLFTPNAIEIMANELTSYPELGMIYADYWLMNAEKRIIRKVAVRSADFLFEHNCIGPCFLYRRAVYDRVGDYDVDSFLQEDYDYWLRVTRRFPARPLPVPLYYYRVHSASLTGRHGLNLFNQFELVRRRHFPDRTFPQRRIALAEWYISHAFEAYWRNDIVSVWGNSLRAIVRKPVLLTNRGVLAILVKSFLRPHR